MTTELTAQTITTRQIRALSREAAIAGDFDQVVLCDHAINELPLEEACKLEMSGWSVKAARQACANAINSARALENT